MVTGGKYDDIVYQSVLPSALRIRSSRNQYNNDWSGGGENTESDPDPVPDAEAKFLLSLSPFSTIYLEGTDDFSRPFPLYPITYIHSKYPVHALSDDVEVNDLG